MVKNTERTNSKKAEIIAAALELFFEKGYEETSIRDIQRKVGKNVAVFYYYFNSKYDVFEATIELFFQTYENNMRKIVKECRINPDHALTKYMDYIFNATQDFREQYLAKLHWSILGAIREHTMMLMRKYVREIIDIYIENGITCDTHMNADAVANLLAYGIGGSMLYQDRDHYMAQEKELKKLLPMLLGNSTRL